MTDVPFLHRMPFSRQARSLGSLRERLRRRHPMATQLARFGLAGGIGTVANALVFLVLRTWWETLAANLVALVLSTLLSTEIHRRFTFEAVSRHRWRLAVQDGGTVVFYACYSSAVLVGLAMLVHDPSPWLQSLTVATASVLGGAGRYLVLRFWVFDRTRAIP